MPCGDKDDCNEATHSQQTAQKEHHEHQDEACTPFCVCSCCASPILHSNVSQDFIVINEMSTVASQPKGLKLLSAFVSIWQPPKIA
jgi:hypothetical protein